MSRKAMANSARLVASRAAPDSNRVATSDGTPIDTNAVPAFQATSWAPPIRRDGGSVARKAQVKNCPAPSTSCETPPTSTRCNASQ